MLFKASEFISIIDTAQILLSQKLFKTTFVKSFNLL